MSMTESEAIEHLKYRIDTARKAVGNGHGYNAFVDMEMAISALEEVQQYRAIGTVSEFRELKEKATAKANKKYCKYCGRLLSLSHEMCYRCGTRN